MKHEPQSTEQKSRGFQHRVAVGAALFILTTTAWIGFAGDAEAQGSTPPAQPVHTAAEGNTPRGLRVEPGDSACRFSGRYGVEPEALLELNQLPGPPEARLPPEAHLVLPVRRPARYRVRPGDSLSQIGTHFGVPARDLARYNALADANQLRVGAWLEIPPGARTACPPESESLATAPVQQEEPEETEPLEIAASAPPAPVASPAPIEVDARDDALVHATTAVRAAEAHYDAADFPGAVALAAVARHVLASLAPGPETEALDARAHWVTALSLVGLDREEEAVHAFRKALRIDPSMAAETALLSPKVKPLVEAARQRETAALIEP